MKLNAKLVYYLTVYITRAIKIVLSTNEEIIYECIYK